MSVVIERRLLFYKSLNESSQVPIINFLQVLHSFHERFHLRSIFCLTKLFCSGRGSLINGESSSFSNWHLFQYKLRYFVSLLNKSSFVSRKELICYGINSYHRRRKIGSECQLKITMIDFKAFCLFVPATLQKFVRFNLSRHFVRSNKRKKNKARGKIRANLLYVNLHQSQRSATKNIKLFNSCKLHRALSDGFRFKLFMFIQPGLVIFILREHATNFLLFFVLEENLLSEKRVNKSTLLNRKSNLIAVDCLFL